MASGDGGRIRAADLAGTSRVGGLSQLRVNRSAVAYRLAQISDTHLSRDKPFFAANFEQVAAHLAAERPDLVVNTGDLSLDGTHCQADLAEALRLHEALDLPVRFIPGNHDVGDSPDVPAKELSSITTEARESYLRLFGEDFWRLDVPGWRIIAVNAQLLGSALPAADEQLAFVGAAAAGAEQADGRRHGSPHVCRAIGRKNNTRAFVIPAQRQRKRETKPGLDVAFASGFPLSAPLGGNDGRTGDTGRAGSTPPA